MPERCTARRVGASCASASLNRSKNSRASGGNEKLFRTNHATKESARSTLDLPEAFGPNRATTFGALSVAPFHSGASRSASSGACLSARSEEHTSELQSLMRISYAVFCLKKKKQSKRLITLLPTSTL